MSTASGQECHTGIPVVGKVPWGSHFCNFYNDKIDLAEAIMDAARTWMRPANTITRRERAGKEKRH